MNRHTIAAGLIVGALTGAAALAQAAPAPKPEPQTWVDYEFRYGLEGKRTATATVETAQVPQVGETVDTTTPAFPTGLQRQWRVVKVIHTPGDPYADATVILED